MAVLVNGDTLRVTVCCYTPTQIGLNVLYYTIDTPVGAPTDAQFATAMDTLMAGPYIAHMPSVANYRGVMVQILTGGAQTSAVSVAGAGAGTAGATLAPSQTCGIISKRGALALRTNRGRGYIPFPGSIFVTAAGAPTAGHLVALGGIANAWGPVHTALVVGAGTLNATMKLATFTTIPGGPPILSSTLSVTTLVPRERFGTQRRRGQYGAQNVLPF